MKDEVVTWRVTEDDLVHFKFCPDAADGQAYVTVPRTAAAMAEHLARPDSQNQLGHVSGGPARIRPHSCIADMATYESGAAQ
jgi:hypothetical protein